MHEAMAEAVCRGEVLGGCMAPQRQPGHHGLLNKMKNIMADTQMRETIAKPEKK